MFSIIYMIRIRLSGWENYFRNIFGRHSTFITWDQRMITGPFVKEVSLQEESDSENDDRHALLQQSVPWQQRCSLLATKQTNQE